MRHFYSLLIQLFFGFALFAQSSVTTIQQNARQFNNRGEHANAVIVLRQGLREFPKALELEKELVLSLTLQRDYAAAKLVAVPLTERNDADIICFQLAGNVYKALEEVKECDQLYKKGIRKFPNSGPLYSEWGELLWSNKDGRAITCWEDGIKEDPSYAGNYYNAALFYANAKEPVWALLYAEIYINMESRSERARNMKKVLFEQYQNILTKNQLPVFKKNESFGKSVYQVLDSASGPAMRGLTNESLTMIRTRFVLDWFAKYGNAYPFKLFDHQRQLLQNGLFEAYDKWLFLEGVNTEAFSEWTQKNADEYARLRSFLFNRIFKIPAGQSYRNR